MSEITVFSPEQTALVSFFDKKGNEKALTPQGALFKGGEALRALKDAACDSALRLAENGRYRPACEILSAAFPSVARAAEKFMSTQPWGSKTNMAAFVQAILREVPKAGKDFSAKQRVARALAVELDVVLTPTVEAERQPA